MSSFTVATWNVNSIRVRLPHVLTWVKDVKPDVLALQELKLSDVDFPFDALREAGYTAVVAGQKTYNGVAILISDRCQDKKIQDKVVDMPGFEDSQRRLLALTLGDIRIVNLYVPNGESVTSQKYQYKLNWLKHCHAFIQAELKRYPRCLVLGDFNIAPEDIDVCDPAYWNGQVLFSQPERQALGDLFHLGFTDCFRKQHPTEQAYSWWDYRMNAFKRNKGLRIDLILASSAMASVCVSSVIDKAPRTWERPSDHAPVVTVFDKG